MIHLPSAYDIEKLPSSAEMRSFDRATIDAGTSSQALMGRAGSAVALRLKALFPDRKRPMLFLCGPGNNGGDGFVAARKLNAAGYRSVRAVLVESDHYSEDLARERKAYVDQGLDLLLFGPKNAAQGAELRISKDGLADLLTPGTVIVDALLGTGQCEAPRGNIAAILDALTEHLSVLDCARIALDIPTGLDADTGALFEPHFEADCTISIERLKRGCVQYPGRAACGELFVETVGIDCSGDCECRMLLPQILEWLPQRRQDAHKGDAGRVLVIGGCADMPGAPVLSAIAALRSGAGIVTLAQLEANPLPSFPPELLLKRLGGTSKFWRAEHADALQDAIDEADVLVVGPGLGTAEETRTFVLKVLNRAEESQKPTVVDADALNAIAASGMKLGGLGLAHAVLTPHPGEAGRLLDYSTAEVQSDRYSAARDLFVRSGAPAVVLKGAGTVIYGEPGGFVNLRGNPWMATAGSGDVLSGMIAAFMAQGMAQLSAAALGVYVHAAAGDLALRAQRGPIIASDIIAKIPSALSEHGDDEEEAGS